MPEIERAIECRVEVRDLQKRVRELESFARWVAIVASIGDDAYYLGLIAERARLILNGD